MLGLADLLFGSFYFGDVRIDGHGSAFCRLALIDLEPMPVTAVLYMGLTRLPVFCQSLGNPIFNPAVRFIDQPSFCGVADQSFKWRARSWCAHSGVQQIAICLVTDDQTVGRVVERKAFRNRFDSVRKSLLA